MKILYRDNDDSISIIMPTQQVLSIATLKNIALKDTPEGLPFWIVDDSEIPEDRTFRDAWEIPEDWGEPDGHGSAYNTFEEIENAENQ